MTLAKQNFGTTHFEGPSILEFVENMEGAAVAIFDRHMRYICASRHWLDYFQLDRQLFIGQSLYDIFAEAPEHWREIHRRCLNGAMEKCDREAFHRSDGRIDWIRWQAYPWRSQSGQIGGIVIYVQDLADEQRLRESEERLRLANAVAGVGIAISDYKTKTIDCSPMHLEIFGFPPDKKPTMQEILDRVHPEDLPTLQKEAFEKGLDPNGTGMFRLTHRVVRPDGKIRWISWVAKTEFAEGPNGREPVRRIGASIDITDLKMSEEKLRAEKIRAEAANEAKSQFLANMSHEIRTPLNAILGFTSLLLEEDAASADIKHYLSKIQKSGAHLLSLVEGVLELSEIEAGKLKIDETQVNLPELLKSIHDTIKPLADAKGLEFTVSVQSLPEKIASDRARLERTIGTVIENAIKFTNQGFVRLDVRSAVRDNQKFLIFSVEDSGVGVPEDKQGMLFKLFMQLDNSHVRKFGGMGVGLYLAKLMVEALNGSLRLVHSRVGVGSCFEIEIPYR